MMRFHKIIIMATLLVGISCGVGAQTQKKIMVFSDPHVMAPSLLESEGTAWTNYLNRERKLVDYSLQLYDEMITRIITDCPDLVLITGDLTKDGEQVSHEYVVSKLNELHALGIQVLVIPGNHDRGSNKNAVYYDGASTTAAAVADNDWFAENYVNYGYGGSSEREKTTLTYACEPIDGLVVIGIDSGKDGIVSSTTLNWVKDNAETAKANGKRVIAMMHHPLIPHFTGVDTFIETAVVDAYETVRNTLVDAGVKVVFTGHIHTSDIAKDWNADMSKYIYDVNTGSLISYPCDYREATLSDDLSKMTITTGHISTLKGRDNFANYASERLQIAIEKAVNSMGKVYALISPTVTKALIIHAEGNEPNNEDAVEILSTLETAADMGVSWGKLSEKKAAVLKVMVNSMLQDKSNYGTAREDVTNDLSLDIDL